MSKRKLTRDLSWSMLERRKVGKDGQEGIGGGVVVGRTTMRFMRADDEEGLGRGIR